jgi:hypothetical protein
MSTYRIISTTTVKFIKYDDVLHVMAKKENGFWTSLFSSGDAHFIISKESPLAKQIQNRTNAGNLLDLDDSMFNSSVLNGTTYMVESKIDSYESAKEQRIEKERKELQLKAQKERETAERKRKAAEEKRRIEEALKNATVHRIPFSNLQMVVDEDDSFSNQMTAIAGNANMSFLCRNNRGFQNSIIELYNKVHGHNSHKLKTVAAKDGQCIGLAFIKMALYFDNGDFQVNEIAAQNAFYCIYKNYNETGNTYALPALFTLLLKKPRALEDELYRSNPDPELVGFGGMTPSAPYRRSDRAMTNRLLIMKFLLKSFYDEGGKKFTIDTTLPYHIPSEDDIIKFTNEYSQSQYVNDKESISKGEEYFNKMFEDIEDQLDI